MRQSVLDRYFEFTIPLEGDVTHMYLDRHEPHGIVTTGRGNALFSIEQAAALPWKRPDGSRASFQEIAIAYNTVFTQGEAIKQRGGNDPAFRAMTSIRLDKTGVQQLVMRTLLENERKLVQQFPAFPTWPANAQLALLSMAWARGPNGFLTAYPKFSAALNRAFPAFDVAASESHLNGIGLDTRNAEDKELLEKAAVIAKRGLDFNKLYLHGEEIGKFVVSVNVVSAGILGVGTVGWAAYELFKYYRT